MTDLTSSELKYLNTMTGKVALGTKLQAILTALKSAGGAAAGTPVNAVNATKTLTVSGVVVDGETVIINNPAVAGSDTYEFLADTAQTKTAPSNKAVSIVANTVKANNTLTLPTQPTANDTMTIGTKVFTFVAHGTATVNGQVDVGTDLASAKLAIVAAINGTDSVNTPHPLVAASVFAGNVTTITALVGGVLGNSIPTVKSFTAVGNVFSAVTLGSGADCSATNAAVALAAAITALDTQHVGGVKDTGDAVILSSDVAGVIGNAIAIGETMAHGAFAAGAVLLSGGVDGTVGLAGEQLFDATYLYLCVANNTVADKNWRKMAVGAEF